MSGFHIGGAGVYSPEYGQVLDGNAMRFAQIINDYDQNFFLEFVPERDRTGEAPYRVVSRAPGSEPYVVRYITLPEMQDPASVLTAIWKGDQRYHSADDILRDMELAETAKRLLDLKVREEAAQEAEDMMVFNISGGRDRKHYIRHNGTTIRR